MKRHVTKRPRVTLTVSCPLELFEWLKRTQRNTSAYVVAAIEAIRLPQCNEGAHEHEDN